MKRSVDHYYVYTMRPGSMIPFYERTCGCESSAKMWVKTYISRGYGSWYLVNETEKESFY